MGESSLRLWKWGNDTYHTGYVIFTLFFCKYFDCYIFKYNKGSYIPKHKDPSCGKKIYRLNFELKKADEGGNFVCHKMLWSFKDRVYFFRADTSYHCVTKIEEGNRVVLSFGFKI